MRRKNIVKWDFCFGINWLGLKVLIKFWLPVRQRKLSASKTCQIILITFIKCAIAQMAIFLWTFANQLYSSSTRKIPDEKGRKKRGKTQAQRWNDWRDSKDSGQGYFHIKQHIFLSFSQNFVQQLECKLHLLLLLCHQFEMFARLFPINREMWEI